mmetsp:Transcript_46448/g.98512  ORF Transcript_46448/g.98512 Transcript_46448/m.98512 type:complete len:353 (+) Transcript_46448:637-1695(+)
MAMAANGNASPSPANAAVPSPCAAAPIPSPLATASFIPAASSIDAPKLAPISPVTTTMVTAREASAPNTAAMAMARGEVMFRDSRLRRRVGLRTLSSRTARAVPYRPPREDTRVDAATSGTFSLMSLFRPYICIARATTAGPRRKRRASPAPAENTEDRDPILYVRRTSRKVDPVSDARAFAAHQVRVVHVTRGCTAFVKDLGRLAPKTKEESVAERRNADRRGAIHRDDGEFLARATADPPVIQASAFRVRKSVLLKGLGGLAFATLALEAATAVVGSSLPPPSPMSFLMPRTDHAVVNRVKRNPPTMTDTTLSTSRASPNPLASGSVMRLGTKNTGSHFANSIAPGFSAS